MILRFASYPALLIALTLPLAACEESATSPSAGGQTTIVLRQSGSASGSLAPSYSATLSALAGPVSLSGVKAIDVTVTQVQALPQNADSSSQGGWVSLDVSGPTKINLVALPTAAESGIQLAQGEIEPGTYGNLRIVFSEATITFAEDVTVGGGPMAKTYLRDTAYPLAIGGGDRRVILIPTAGFTVAEDATSAVVVTFDGSASVRTVIATPVGMRIAPVLTAQGRKTPGGS